jgi:P-type Mg2+ transporter
LFSLALAVGLTPQLLPAITSVTLARGARRMAKEKVIVRRLASIENFGSMNVLCSDKTGTLTEGKVRLRSTLNLEGEESERVFLHAYLNAFFEKGYQNPIDEALRSRRELPDISGYEKLDEVPYDFVRKRLSVLVSQGEGSLLITKGALGNVLSVCATAELPNGEVANLAETEDLVRERFRRLSGEGFRVLGVARRDLPTRAAMGKEGESGMTFLGFLVLADPPKEGVAETIGRLRALGCSLKVISGDNRLVATSVAEQVGLEDPEVITGEDLHRISDAALPGRAGEANVFAEVEPNQKERIILALKKRDDVVGYLGDGINDAPALHAADVGLSVQGAADVAKEAADMVLLEKDLGVLEAGVREGRKTFANTLKYVFITTSANFGNMFSMAGLSLLVSFLPLLPKQILLINFLTDSPAMTIATDAVDGELVDKPRRWNMKFIRNFMFVFGLISSVFDYLTFGALLLLLNASVVQFRTGWFLESVITELLTLLIIRTRRPFFGSRIGRYLLGATLTTALVSAILPYTPLAVPLDFAPLPPAYLLVLGLIAALYAATTEIAKKIFYARSEF